MLRHALVATAFCVCAFAVENAPSKDPKGTAPADSSSKIADPHDDADARLTAAPDKAKVYDKWSEKQKVAVAKAMGRGLGDLPAAEQADAIAQMTEQEKADAYDYYVNHDQKALKKIIKNTN